MWTVQAFMNEISSISNKFIADLIQQKDVDRVLVPTKVKSLECRAVDVSMGPHHTAVLKETGQVGPEQTLTYVEKSHRYR